MKIKLLIILLIVLSGCSGDRCIDADDFGHSTFEVPARYSSKEFKGQKEDNQVAPWLNSEYRITGKPLAIMVRGWDNGIESNTESEVSAWCAWYGTSKDKSKLSNICTRFKECEFANEETCTQTPDANIINAPCIFKKGVGLYALVPEIGIDPNLTEQSRKEPSGLTFHVGAVTDEYGMYEVTKKGEVRVAGGRVYNFGEEDASRIYRNSELHFKILDKFYNDNSGKYKVVIKSGISRIDSDPIFFVVDLVESYIFGKNFEGGIVQGIYQGIIGNAGYRLAVTSLLSLYVMYTAMLYLIGNIEVTKTELLVRIVKIALVGALLTTESSWNFFNNYLFVYFVAGVRQILGIIFEAGATGPGAPGIIGLLIAPQTLAKILALIFTDWLGIVYAIILLIIIIVLLFIFFQAAVIYLSAVIAISLMIIMGPIFICFLLFDFTKSLFDNWLKQLISHAFQPILLFTGIIFISVMIRHEIYASLGFKVCKQNMLYMVSPGAGALGSVALSLFDPVTEEAVGSELSNSIFYWWFPEPMSGSDFTRETKLIPIPEAHFEDDEINGTVASGGGKFCSPYECAGERYVDLPFLHPVKDIRRLTQFWNGNFVQLTGLVVIIISMYLLFKFNSVAINIARFLTGTGNNASNMQAAGNSFTSDMKNMLGSIKSAAVAGTKIGAKGVGKAAAYANSKISNKDSGTGRILSKSLVAIQGASGVVHSTMKNGLKATVKTAIGNSPLNKYSPSNLIDKMRIKMLKGEALSAGANSAVLSEVKRKTGLTRDNIDPNAEKSYKSALEKKIYNLTDKSLPDAERQKIAKNTAENISKKRISESGNNLAKAKYGREFDKLSDSEKLELKKIMTDKDLRKLSDQNAKAVEFKNAYVKAYAGLSEQGVGLLGKNVKSLRMLQKTQHRYKSDAKDRKEKDKMLGRKILGVFDNDSHISGTNNPRKLTLGEAKAAERDQMNQRKVENQISRLSSKKGELVTTPEFLARAQKAGDPNLQKYERLAKASLDAQIERTVNEGSESPSGTNKYNRNSTTFGAGENGKAQQYGDHYSKNVAKDSNLRESIDHLRQTEKALMSSNDFIAKEEGYRLSSEDAAAKITSASKQLGMGKDDSLADLSAKLDSEMARGNISSDRRSELSEYKKAIDTYQENSEVLDKIKDVKDQIHDNIQGRIDKINKFRVDASMDEY